ncbi:butyrate kinase [bacterium]|nr:butyrate kinase [bacterium]
MMPRDSRKILVINPGSTSTKIALFENESLIWQECIEYQSAVLARFRNSLEQLPLRQNDIGDLLKKKQVDISSIDAVAGRGGPFRPLESGTYRIDKRVLNDVKQGKVQADHISNIGVLLADHFARQADAPAFFVDPVCVDEFDAEARYSGLPELERRSLLHALNIKAVARQAASVVNKTLAQFNGIVAHLGGGISVCAIRNGRMVDVNNANEEGPFSPERSGSLPVSSLVRLCFSGRYGADQMKKKIVGQGGLTAYLGTNRLPDIWERIDRGDDQARQVLRAMTYQIAKEIGAMAAVLFGHADAVVLTGGLCHDDRLMSWIDDRVAFIGPVIRIPGEREMEALASGVLRVIRNEESCLEYPHE